MVLTDTFREIVQPVDEYLLTVHEEKSENDVRAFVVERA
jgi:hypothetical protein